jgi:hypothetical protein
MLEWLGLIPLLGLQGNWRGYKMGGKAIGGVMDADMKGKFEAARAAGDMDKAKAMADKVMADKPEKQKGKTKFNPDGKNATEAGFRGFKQQSQPMISEVKTAAGTSISAEIIDGAVSFKINKSYAASNVADPVAAGKLALGTLKDMASKVPDGTLLLNMPFGGDGKGAARDRVYQKLGFGPKVGGLGIQFTIVKGGKAYPVDQKFYDKYVLPEITAGRLLN